MNAVIAGVEKLHAQTITEVYRDIVQVCQPLIACDLATERNLCRTVEVRCSLDIDDTGKAVYHTNSVKGTGKWLTGVYFSVQRPFNVLPNGTVIPAEGRPGFYIAYKIRFNLIGQSVHVIKGAKLVDTGASCGGLLDYAHGRIFATGDGGANLGYGGDDNTVERVCMGGFVKKKLAHGLSLVFHRYG